MKLIIAGSRSIHPHLQFIHSSILMLGITSVSEVVSGTAYGVDLKGEYWARHYSIPVKLFEAYWDKHGKAAGPIRNKEMAEYADALLLIWNGESRGSANMKSEMLKLGKPVYEIIMRKVIK